MASARTSYITEDALQPFLSPTFDAASYLNATLPSLTFSQTARQPTSQAGQASLAELSSQTQTLVSQLNAQLTRLSTTLTQLTDDILRSGGRLAYEVELLRGETVTLSETLQDRLADDVSKFVHSGLSSQAASTANDEAANSDAASDSTTPAQPETSPDTSPDAPTAPTHISHLRTLTLVRSRLESVIRIFGTAMSWTLPPSELSLTSSLISVSAPDSSTSSDDVQTREMKGRAYAEQIRNEISELILGHGGAGASDGTSGFEKAMERIQALRDLAVVWKGTAEEKARVRFVESLVKLAEEKQKAVEKERGGDGGKGWEGSPTKRGVAGGQQVESGVQRTESGYRFLDNLKRIRGDMYLE